MNEYWLNELLRDGGGGMSKTITVRRSELGTLRNGGGGSVANGLGCIAAAIVTHGVLQIIFRD